MGKYNPIVSYLVRSFIRKWPITEGKKQVIKLLRPYLLPLQDPVVVSPMKSGFSLKLNIRNKEHAHMYLYGEHDERYEVAFVKKAIRPGDTVWDIGANIGFYSQLFSKLAPSGKVYSFEPVKETRGYLASQLEINHSNNVTILDFALGNDTGEVEIYFNDPILGEGTASIHAKDKAFHETIKIRRIDDIAKDYPVPDFIKIDVEGHQNQLLLGGMEFFDSHSPLIMAELRDKPETMIETQKLVSQLGYDFYEIKKRGALSPVRDFMTSKSRNFVLCKKKSTAEARILNLLSGNSSA